MSTEHRSASSTGSGSYVAASVDDGTLKAQMDVMHERMSQRAEFPPDADDQLEPAEWVARIAKHVGRAVSQDPREFRKELVVLGALALAAIESFDRKYGAVATRGRVKVW